MKKNVSKLLVRARAAIADNSVSNSERQSIIDEINNVIADEKGSPWWVIALKVLAYAIGLILAGFGTTTAAACLGILPMF